MAVLASAAAAPTPQYYVSSPNKYFATADAYARAASLPMLRPSTTAELRIWMRGYMAGGGTGTRIAKSTRQDYAFKTQYLDATGEVEVFPAKQISSTAFHADAALLAALRKVAAFNSRELSCGVMDGWGAVLDFTVDGKRFALTASNTDVCKDAGAMAVNELLQILKSDQP